ncbi:LysR family transcriptional regulator [Alloacidobacterium dinghuense]|uniref:LysR family transcriptional regulator n=1 Tax=Alloacidobacterium dinghuense TaxID=2763107 RepID=A0A7G8BM96_9BACT|nr:LysR family transcriptional regulator [Alloacidobacterium dinghuense]QNI33666.1 LysR family transcriptional regulator [Alloacidobacterium dinghuense]
MELRQLQYFCSVVQAGSFTKAAEQEGIAQPSLSQQIQRLERTLGTVLFVRLGRSVQLTHAGTVFYPYARDILNQAKRATTQIRQLETEIRGPLRVGVIPTVLPYLVAPNLHEFSAQYPEVEVILEEALTEQLTENLKACELDLIIVSLPLKGAELLRDPLVLVTAKSHKFVSLPVGANRDLSGERLLLLKEGHCFREDMLTACRRSQAEMAPAFESDHFGSIFPLVAAGAGVSIAPLMAAYHAHGCSIVSLARPQFRRVGFARLKSGAHFKPLTAFTKWLRTVAADANRPANSPPTDSPDRACDSAV